MNKFKELGVSPVIIKMAVLALFCLTAFNQFGLTHLPKFVWMSVILAIGTFVNVRFLVKDKVTSWLTSASWALLALTILLKMSSIEFYAFIPNTKTSFALAALIVVGLNVIAAKVSDFVGIAYHESASYEKNEGILGFTTPKYIGVLALIFIIFTYATRL